MSRCAVKIAGDDKPPLVAILLISAAALAYEILLIRLFSIVQWHHFAYMVISLALLGYGASGTFVTIFRVPLLAAFGRSFRMNATLFGMSTLLCFQLAQRLPFNTLEMFWDTSQLVYLLLAYLLLFVPFFFAANCICISFARFGDRIARIYAFDLLGAGLGALGIILALYLIPPQEALRWLAAIGLLVAGISVLESMPLACWQRAVPYMSMALILLLLPGHWFALNPSPYKALNQTLQISGTRIVDQHHSPLGSISLVESKWVPFRLASGLSLNNQTEPPSQLALFFDGDAPSPLTRYEGDRGPLVYLDFQTSALPYHLRQFERVLILGLGGGSSLLQAEYHHSAQVDVVELDPWLPNLLQNLYAEFAGWRWLQDTTQLHLGEARSFIANHDRRYDLIQMSLLDAASATSGGVYGLSENYLYTVEAVNDYLGRLRPEGLLAITRWAKLPPRDGVRLFATVIEALRRSGRTDPGAHLAMIRGWDTTTLVVKNGELNAGEIAALLDFCTSRAFDVVHYPGMPQEGIANRYNTLSQPYFHQGARALLGEGANEYIARYKFNIAPTSDDSPYFFNFFKWRTLPEIVSLYRRGGFALLELGYPVMVLTLVQAILVSIPLILLPLHFLKRTRDERGRVSRWRLLGYFLLIGLAYLFIEIAFIQKFTLFLAHPTLAVAVVIAGFLIFSGLGSLAAGRVKRERLRRMLVPTILLLSIFAVGYSFALPVLFKQLGSLETGVRVCLVLMLIAPLAFCMGIPFPAGLSEITRNTPQLVPWAWGINGCASLISAVLASLLAIHVGFNRVVLIAVALYLLTIYCYPKAPESH